MTAPIRPLRGPDTQGYDAFFEDVEFAACPYGAGSHSECLWRAGWLEASVVGEEEEAGRDHADDVRAEARHFRGAARLIRHEVSALLPSAEAVGEAVGLPPDKWPMRCYEVAALAAKSGLLQPACDAHGPVRLFYGLYGGNISAASPFSGRPPPRHGWLEFDSGPVVDPTRWVFTATSPRLAVVAQDEYDVGALRSKASLRRTPPPYDADKAVAFPCRPAVAREIDRALGCDGRVSADGRICHGQAMRVASRHPALFGRQGRSVFEALVSNGFAALIPVDTREMLFGEPAIVPAAMILRP